MSFVHTEYGNNKSCYRRGRPHGSVLCQGRKTLSCLRQNGMVFEVLFMDASDAVLVKRYKESRRMHPLCSAENPRIEDGIEKERKILQQVKKDADYVIDTSKLLTRELKEELDRIFVKMKSTAV